MNIFDPLSQYEEDAAAHIAATIWDLDITSLRARQIFARALVLAYGLRDERSA